MANRAKRAGFQARNWRMGGEEGGELINRALIFVRCVFEFVVAKASYFWIEMSGNAIRQNQGKVLGQGLSKRQQMKLEKTLKIIQAQENQQIHSRKRRAHTHLHVIEPNPRKQIKTDSNSRASPSEDIISSHSHEQEHASTSPVQPPPPPQDTACFLNPLYAVPEGQAGLFNYLLCYSYEQGERLMEKQSQDWNSLDSLGEQTLTLVKGSSSVEVCNKLEKRFSEVRQKIKEPFGKAHRQFAEKYLNKPFLLQ